MIINRSIDRRIQTTEDDLEFKEIFISTQNPYQILYINESLECCVRMRFNKDIENFNLSLSFCDESGFTIFVTTTPSADFKKGEILFKCKIPDNLLNTRIYSVVILLVKNSSQVLCRIDNALVFEMHEEGREGAYFESFGGGVRPLLNWEYVKL